MNPPNGLRARETVDVSAQRDALILAIDEVTLGIGQHLLRMLNSEVANRAHDAPVLDWPLLVTSGVGGALRLIHHVQPRGLFVCVGLDQLEAAAALIATVRRRRARLPQVALAGEHDERIERAVRTAGAAYYFPLADRFDRDLLHSALNAIGIGPAPPARPARFNGSPAPPLPQARGRPPDVSRL